MADKKIKVIDPFTNIEPPENSTVNPNANSLEGMSAGGASANGMKVDRQGMWFGSKLFGDAVFSVDMLGNLVANSVTLTGGVIKSGKTSFSDSVNAGYYISPEGIYFGSASDARRLKYTVSSGVLDLIGTISGRNTATVAAAINASGYLITEMVNSKLDTQTKEILGAFTFGVSGAINIPGSSLAGLFLSPTGILGKDTSGNTTFAINASNGAATFKGAILSGTSIAAPVITGGSIVGGAITITTAAGLLIQTGGDITFESTNGTTFSELIFNRTSGSNEGWNIFYVGSGGGGFNSGDFMFLPQSSNDSNTVRFGLVTDPCHIVVHGNGNFTKVFNSNTYIQVASYDFRRVGFTFKDGSGVNRYIEVLAVNDPV